MAKTSRGIQLRPPEPFDNTGKPHSVFLAGAIDMGNARDWQSDFVAALEDHNVLLLNPRRLDWDSSWEQTLENKKFREQVEWEIDAQEYADTIAMYFPGTSQAPITLLELGLFARSGKPLQLEDFLPWQTKQVIVACEPGYWRRGNVEVVCAKYGVRLLKSYDELVEAVKQRLPSNAD
eukprot:gene8781-1574_t